MLVRFPLHPTNQHMWKFWSVVFMLALVITAKGRAKQLFKFESGSEQTALLELYTSEGCNSCPPAEEQLTQLRNSPRLWKDFVPVAFHVDYWNQLGWKDPWSTAEFSERQQSYAQAWHSGNVYTPCFILNGKEWHGWLTGRNGPPVSHQLAGILTVTSGDTNLWQASFFPEKPANTRYEIHATLLIGGISSDVKAGENKGRRLKHDFAAMYLVHFGMAASNGVVQGKFILDTPPFDSEKTLAIAVWVTRAGQLEPLQATGGWLVPQAKKSL